jgi:5-methylcytosine-specific restriction endonuclease McrA
MSARDPYKDREYVIARPVVLAEAGYRCEIRLAGCRGTATTVDHITPLIDGGTHARTNLRAACVSCNSRLGAPLSARRRALRRMGRRSRKW